MGEEDWSLVFSQDIGNTLAQDMGKAGGRDCLRGTGDCSSMGDEI